MTEKAGFLFDVNVLIAMAWPTHDGHKKVQQWFSTHAPSGWATCPITQSAFVRILSNPSFSPNALSPRDALALLQTNLAHSEHRFWPDEIGLVQALKPLAPQLEGHQQVTDAYLLGLAMHKEGKFVTMDKSVVRLLPEKVPPSRFIEVIV
jgi:toxin-antitoxin system PIN domain toxin